MTNANKITDINKKLEEKLFDNHMQTMFDLIDELLEREELTETEDSFVDAFMEWNKFLCRDDEEDGAEE